MPSKESAISTLAVTVYFEKGTVPKQTCDTHVAVEICKKTDKLANKKCPKSERIKKVYIVRKNGSHGKTADTKFLLPEK